MPTVRSIKSRRSVIVVDQLLVFIGGIMFGISIGIGLVLFIGIEHRDD